MEQKAILYGINLNKISSKEAVLILQNPKEDLISTIPPVEPKGGELYLISMKVMRNGETTGLMIVTNG